MKYKVRPKMLHLPASPTKLSMRDLITCCMISSTGTYEGSAIIEYTYRDDITVERLSSKKIRINLPSSHPSSAKLLHIYSQSFEELNTISELFFIRNNRTGEFATLDSIHMMVKTDRYSGFDVFTEGTHSVDNNWLYMENSSIVIDINNMTTDWFRGELIFDTNITNLLETSILFLA